MAMDKKLIDAQDAVRLLLGKCVAKYPSSFLMGLLAAASEIEGTPEAETVVRCKDCKWFAPNNDGYWLGCAIDTRNPDDEPKPDDFCSFGERKVDNG